MHRLLWPIRSGESRIASLFFPKSNSVFATCPSRLWIRGQRLASPICWIMLSRVCDRSFPGSTNVGWGNALEQMFIWTPKGKAKAGPERQLSRQQNLLYKPEELRSNSRTYIKSQVWWYPFANPAFHSERGGGDKRNSWPMEYSSGRKRNSRTATGRQETTPGSWLLTSTQVPRYVHILTHMYTHK